MVLLILSSCATVSDSSASTSEAVTSLVRDMAAAVEEKALTVTDLEGTLDSSYRAYSEYIPSYDEIKKGYLGSVLVVIDKAASLFSPVVLSAGEEASLNPSPYLEGALVTDAIRTSSSETLNALLTEYLLAHSAELDDAFSESADTFSRVRKAYAALSSVGEGVSLPVVKEASLSVLSSTVVRRYFELLEDAERDLRSNPLYGVRSLYLENQT